MRAAHRTYEYDGRMSAFDASLSHYLRIRTPERSMELLDMIIWRVVDEECSIWPRVSRHRNITLLLRVIERIEMDRAMWDFIGIALFIAVVYRNHDAEYAISRARATSARVLPALLDRSPVHAMCLTWDRVHDLAIEWLQRSPAAYQIGSVCGVPPCSAASLSRWMQTVLRPPHAQGAQRAWDSAIHRRMQRNAYDAQNELRCDLRIPGDLVGLIAQFLAPPNTTQAQLKHQREIYASTIQIARLCVQARAPDLSDDAMRDLQRQADLARGALLGQPPGVAVSQTLLSLHRMPTASARARDEGERHPKRQRTSESPI
jgi:hypothetical protein